MKDFFAKLFEPIDILARKVTSKMANQVIFLLCAGLFFIMVAIAYNIIFRGELPKAEVEIPAAK